MLGPGRSLRRIFVPVSVSGTPSAVVPESLFAIGASLTALTVTVIVRVAESGSAAPFVFPSSVAV